MTFIDYSIITFYFFLVIGTGIWCRRLAARNLDSYFLAGKNMHWLALAMSGSVATFDITGTMWIVTLLTLFGMRSMWNHWMWGFLMAAFFMSYMGKWVRRSEVMTGAEWMAVRFGTNLDGRVARVSYSLMAITTLTGLVGYAFQGIGKFASVYITFGLPPQTAATVCAIVVFAITTLYVLLGGLYSVVVTNVIQTLILTLASLVIAGVAFVHVSPELIAKTLPPDWMSLAPKWHLDASQLPDAYASYELFGALVIIWVVKGLLLNLGGPGQMTDFQAFLATRDARDACKLGAAWSGFLVVRWAMCMGIALLALTGLEASGDPEMVMPVVLREYLPAGLRGLVIAGLLAAFMSTFSASVNAAASYVVRDLWQPLFPRMDTKGLVRASYAATLAVVLVGSGIGFLSDSIRQIWDWLMIALGGAFIVPNVLRWYWWRLNGWGYSAGSLAGLATAILILLATLFLKIEPPLYLSFPVVCAISFLATLAGTWLTNPTEQRVLESFFTMTRPFGLWGPVRGQIELADDQRRARSESPAVALINVALSSALILGCYLGPMYLVGHWFRQAAVWLSLAALASVTLYFTWYRNLPPSESTRT